MVIVIFLQCCIFIFRSLSKVHNFPVRNCAHSPSRRRAKTANRLRLSRFFVKNKGISPILYLVPQEKKEGHPGGCPSFFSDISLCRQTQRSATALRIHLPLFTRSRETAAPMAQPAGMDHQMELAPRGVR